MKVSQENKESSTRGNADLYKNNEIKFALINFSLYLNDFLLNGIVEAQQYVYQGIQEDKNYTNSIMRTFIQAHPEQKEKVISLQKTVEARAQWQKKNYELSSEILEKNQFYFNALDKPEFFEARYIKRAIKDWKEGIVAAEDYLKKLVAKSRYRERLYSILCENYSYVESLFMYDFIFKHLLAKNEQNAQNEFSLKSIIHAMSSYDKNSSSINITKLLQSVTGIELEAKSNDERTYAVNILTHLFNTGNKYIETLFSQDHRVAPYFVLTKTFLLINDSELLATICKQLQAHQLKQIAKEFYLEAFGDKPKKTIDANTVSMHFIILNEQHKENPNIGITFQYYYLSLLRDNDNLLKLEKNNQSQFNELLKITELASNQNDETIPNITHTIKNDIENIADTVNLAISTFFKVQTPSTHFEKNFPSYPLLEKTLTSPELRINTTNTTNTRTNEKSESDDDSPLLNNANIYSSVSSNYPPQESSPVENDENKIASGTQRKRSKSELKECLKAIPKRNLNNDLSESSSEEGDENKISRKST